MSYEQEDMYRLNLREDLAEEFAKLHRANRYKLLEDYKISEAYKNATNSIQRAKIAVNAKPHPDVQKRLFIKWLELANQMTMFEKAMLGWDKYE